MYAGKRSVELEQLNKSLEISLTSGDLAKCQTIVEDLVQRSDQSKISDIKALSESYYFIGVYYLLVRNYYESIRFLNLSVEIKERTKIKDDRLAKSFYNLGVAYNNLGDFNSQEVYSLKSLEVEEEIYGKSNPFLLGTYSSLIIAYIGLMEYDKSINFGNIALNLANSNLDNSNPYDLADLYSNLGVLYVRLADYSKAKIYLDKSESIYKEHNLDLGDNYINLMNNLAITCGELRFKEKSDEYFERGISLAISNNSSLAYNLINSFAIVLGNNSNPERGEALLSKAITSALVKFGENSHSYIEVLNNYANYLREYNIDNTKSLECYGICMKYLSNYDNDSFLKTSIYIGYSLSLSEAGDPDKALEMIQSLLFTGDDQKNSHGKYENPAIASINPDKKSLQVFKVKYKILWDLYRRSPDLMILEAASGTSEFIVSLLEKVRINISEEESRLVLGDKYRDSYLNAIRDFNLIYTKTADRRLLVKAFQYSEKSKVAGLLTSTRELKASQFHIPSDIADFERNLQRDLSLYNAHIAEESNSIEPDEILIKKLNENLLETTRSRDSLIRIFEQNYPEYYSIKYNTEVVNLKDISVITGRNGNYISYVVSDTILYIFVANRKIQDLLALPIDSDFLNNIKKFRSLLSIPSPSENAQIAFRNFQSAGFALYKTLIDPIRKYLISDELIISPDNILSYLPFEALPTSLYSGEGIYYRELDYLMNHFDVSYTYSATFMAESVKKEKRTANTAIAFAPNYTGDINVQSFLGNRQPEMSVLSDLPYARQEAEFVSGLTGGMLYINNEARESVYKSESGKYDIIHLAMHTLLNDIDPMNSTLIFSPENDTLEDSYLKTFEVYGIPLRAKMVVLSSCNTGSGILSSGEGILSLARGFLYSGSQSVVMSMWEIEDRSGTEIVKMFYENLKLGKSKSVALRKARITFLKKADQLRSHPYFWATLVIYGNNAPLYYAKSLIYVSLVIFLIMFVSITLYLRKRKYS